MGVRENVGGGLVAHILQVLEVLAESTPEGGDVVVLNAVLLAHLLHDGGNTGVVVLTNAREEMVDGLVVESAAQEGSQPVVVSIVDSCANLSDGPFGVVKIVGNFGEVSAGGDMRDLEVEGKVVASNELRHEEQRPENSVLLANTEVIVRNEETPEHPERLGAELTEVFRLGIVDADGTVGLSHHSVSQILNSELETKNTVEDEEVDVLELIEREPFLHGRDTTNIAFHLDGEIRISANHVGVDVVTENVLVVPREKRGTTHPVHSQTADQVPAPLRMAHGGVRAIVHAMKERKGLEATENNGGNEAKEKVLGNVSGDGDVPRRQSNNNHKSKSPKTREGIFRVILVILEVLLHFAAKLSIEA